MQEYLVYECYRFFKDHSFPLTDSALRKRLEANSVHNKFSFTSVKIRGQGFVRPARKEVVTGSLPVKSTFVVNSNGDFAGHATDADQNVSKRTDSKGNTSNNSYNCSEN